MWYLVCGTLFVVPTQSSRTKQRTKMLSVEKPERKLRETSAPAAVLLLSLSLLFNN